MHEMAGRLISRNLRGFAPAQQRSYFVLDDLQFAQAQLRISHDEDIAAVPVFVDEQAIAVGNFYADLFEDTFAFEHHGQDKTGVCRRFRLRYQAAEKLLCVFFR